MQASTLTPSFQPVSFSEDCKDHSHPCLAPLQGCSEDHMQYKGHCEHKRFYSPAHTYTPTGQRTHNLSGRCSVELVSSLSNSQEAHCKSTGERANAAQSFSWRPRLHRRWTPESQKVMLLAFGDFPEQLAWPCTNTSLVLTCSALIWWHLPICEGLGLCHPLKATHLKSCLDSACEQRLCPERPQAGKGTSPPTQEKKKT